VDVLDKGVGAVIIVGVDTFNEKGKPLFYNQFALFMVGSGNFGGKRNSSNPEVKPLASPPDRSPDVIVSQQTSVDQVNNKHFLKFKSFIQLFLMIFNCYLLYLCFRPRFTGYLEIKILCI